MSQFFEQFSSELLIVVVVTLIAATLWHQKSFWLKALGGLAFATAIVKALGSPALLIMLGVSFVLYAGIVMLMKRRKRRKHEKAIYKKYEDIRHPLPPRFRVDDDE